MGLRLDTDVKRIAKAGDGSLILYFDGGDSLVVDAVMFATGRSPNTKGLGLERAGVTVAASGAIPVDQYSATNVAHIHAIGDVTDRLQLTPVAIKEAMAYVATVFGGGRRRPTTRTCRPPSSASPRSARWD